jgi:hypothetical protein
MKRTQENEQIGALGAIKDFFGENTRVMGMSQA